MNKFARALLVTALALPVAVADVGGGAAVAAEPIPDDPSVAVASGTVLPFSGNLPGDVVAGDVVVDEGHGHVFVSGGRLETGVAVTDLEGRLVGTIPDLRGADGMVLSADGSTLYVGLAVDRAIAAVDTTTLAVSTYPTQDRCPRYVALIDGDPYFTGACGGDYWFDVARLDTATGVVERVTFAGEPDSYVESAGPIVPDPVRGGRFYVTDNRSGLFQVHAYELDGTGLTATRTATHDSFGSWVFGIDVSPDGQTVLAGNGDGVVGLESTSLTRFADYEATVYSEAVAANGSYVASAENNHVTIANASGSYGRSFFFDGNVGFGRDALAWGPDRLYAVVEDFGDGSLRLFTLTGHSLPAPLLYLGGSGNSSSVGSPLQWDVSATFSGQPFAGRPLWVWRSGPDGLTSLGQPSTGVDGSVTIDDTPPQKGTYTYTVLYDGDSDTAPARLRWNQWVSGLSTRLAFDKPPVFGPDETIVMTGRLTGPGGSPIADAAVELTETYGGQRTTLPSVTTDAEGGFSFETSGGSLGQHQFSAHYAGDTRYDESGDAETAWVKHHVVVDLAAPAAYLVRTDPVTFSGTVTRDDGGPVAGQSLTWRRYAPGSTTVRTAATVTTGADGSFTFTDQYADKGPIRWEVVYGGDATLDRASAEVTVPVYADLPSIDITTDRSRYTYNQQAAVDVWVQDGSYGSVKLYSEPYAQTRRLVATGTSGAGVDVSTALTMTRNARLTAVFEPSSTSFQAAPNEASVTIAVRPLLAQGVHRSYDTSGRTYLVHRAVDPRLTLKVSPRLPGRCVRVRVERYRDGAYALVRRTGCIALDGYSRAAWTLTGNPPAGARFRLRYLAPGDAAFAGARARWAYVRFTR